MERQHSSPKYDSAVPVSIGHGVIGERPRGYFTPGSLLASHLAVKKTCINGAQADRSEHHESDQNPKRTNAHRNRPQ